MEVKFNNLTVTIEAESAEEAYTLLCQGLKDTAPVVEWETDTYSTEATGHNDRPTQEIWPVQPPF